jgi:hypothetical protein
LHCDGLSAGRFDLFNFDLSRFDLSTIRSAGEEGVCGCEHLRLPTIAADRQLDPAHIKLSTNTFVQYTRFFSYGLIATVIPSEGT